MVPTPCILLPFVRNIGLKTFEFCSDMNLHTGEFQVMPNHFHAIIGIGKNKYNTKIDGGDGGCCDDGRDAMHRVSTKNALRFYKKRNAFFTAPALPDPPNIQLIYATRRCVY